MKRQSAQRTVRFDYHQLLRLEAIADEQGRFVADILRTAIDQYLLGHKLVGESQMRHHRISEYSQIALDTIILEQHPEFRDRIVTETDRRMARYHGAVGR